MDFGIKLFNTFVLRFLLFMLSKITFLFFSKDIFYMDYVIENYIDGRRERSCAKVLRINCSIAGVQLAPKRRISEGDNRARSFLPFSFRST